MDTSIIDKIGFPAFLEQLAEESAELTQASLKYARKLRNENPTPKELEDIYANFIEEIADVATCVWLFEAFKEGSGDQITNIAAEKYKRWKKRLKF